MSEGRLVVNFAGLETANQQIQTAISTMQTKLDDLDREARPLVDTWSGVAQQEYQQRQTQWTQAAGDLTAILVEIQKSLAASAQEYQATEQANAKLFG
jgi:early secretory antigenic target protein ESAT-6